MVARTFSFVDTSIELAIYEARQELAHAETMHLMNQDVERERLTRHIPRGEIDPPLTGAALNNRFIWEANAPYRRAIDEAILDASDTVRAGVVFGDEHASPVHHAAFFVEDAWFAAREVDQELRAEARAKAYDKLERSERAAEKKREAVRRKRREEREEWDGATTKSCSKGCPCGNSCISCDRVCRK